MSKLPTYIQGAQSKVKNGLSYPNIDKRTAIDDFRVAKKIEMAIAKKIL